MSAPLEPKAVLRELILGAVDRLDPCAEGDAAAREIRLLPDSTAGTLAITDNGAGLSLAEVENGLANAGSGTEGFWAGLLACRPLCSHLEVLTRVCDSGTHVLLTADGETQIGPAEVESPGTSVHLQLHREHSSLLNDDLLTRLIKKSCDFVRIPIYLRRGWDPVNLMDAPWYREVPAPQLKGELERILHIRTLAAFPFQISENSGRPCLRGALYVRSWRHSATLRLYCRRVFVTAAEADLLGPGLRDLISGVIDVDTPSRAECHRLLEPGSSQGAWLQSVLLRIVAQGFHALARQRKKQLQQLMDDHGPSIKAACLAFPEELGELRNHLPYRTSLRDAATLPEVLEGRPDRTVTYADDLDVAAPLVPLYRRTNTEVVYMTAPADEKLRAQWSIQGIEFRRADLKPPLPPAADEEAALAERLEQLFQTSIDPGLTVELRALGPDGPSAILSLSEDGRRKLEMFTAIRSRRQQGRTNELPPELRQLAESGALDTTSIPQQLILNRSHGIVAQCIAALGGSELPAEGIALPFARFLHAQALLSAGLHLPRSRIAELSRSMIELTINLLAAERSGV
jgi:HSP90 family molecular chaperone